MGRAPMQSMLAAQNIPDNVLAPNGFVDLIHAKRYAVNIGAPAIKAS